MTAIEVLEDFVRTVEAVGGLYHDAYEGRHTLHVDPDWLDLADVYVDACTVLGRKPMYDDPGYGDDLPKDVAVIGLSYDDEY